ncbi:hypothetical protein BDZ89DRAFT_1054160 [Hymenopellis radicata]|nr:hypothetical protein BDZ89DRAFT_1054160 [Hymenopellis radicata]
MTGIPRLTWHGNCNAELRNVRRRGEDVGTVGSRAFNAVSVIDPAFSRFVVHVKILEIVVKVDGTCGEAASQERCSCGKDGSDIDMVFAVERDGKSCQPFVKAGQPFVKAGDNGCARWHRLPFHWYWLPVSKSRMLGAPSINYSPNNTFDTLGAHALEDGGYVRACRFLLLSRYERRLVRQWPDASTDD